MEDTKEFLAITSWAEEDRPREKLLAKGKSALSDAELVAILLRTGVKGSSAVDIAKKILHHVHGDLNELGKLSVADIKKLEKGLGDTKAITIAAALELGRRRQSTAIREKPVIHTSRDSFDYIYPELADLHHEEFYVIYLNKAGKVLQHKHISTGGITGTIADIRLILKHALELFATSFVAIHNHPSCNLKPSQSDIDLTKKVKNAAALMDITLLDHLIIGEKRFYSFADEGMM